MAGPPTILTIDELAAVTGTTTRRLRSFQTLGLLAHPELRGRTGLYGEAHVERASAILRLQERGFSLESLAVLFDALDRGATLADVLGLRAGPRPMPRRAPQRDDAELYGFSELESGRAPRRAGGSLLSIVPTTMWDESEAS